MNIFQWPNKQLSCRLLRPTSAIPFCPRILLTTSVSPCRAGGCNDCKIIAQAAQPTISVVTANKAQAELRVSTPPKINSCLWHTFCFLNGKGSRRFTSPILSLRPAGRGRPRAAAGVASKRAIVIKEFKVSFEKCIAACQACLVDCEFCLYEMATKQSHNDCPRCCIECVDICGQCVRSMARNSRYTDQLCQKCAEICEWCAEQCAAHEHDHCQRCAASCRHCAEECRQIARAAA